MTGRLEGKRVLLFGATGKLGRAVALLFGQEGAKLTLVSRSEERLSALQERLTPSAGAVATVLADPSTAEGCRRAVEEAVACFGGLDVLYYGAGAFKAVGKTVDGLTEKEWDLLVGSNLKGAFLACKSALPLMAHQGGGSAILMGGTWSDWLSANAAYAAAKAGLLGLTQRLALEWRGSNVRVNAILPHHVSRHTRAQVVTPVDEPLAGEGRAEDVAYLALFLASAESRHVTGVAIPVDGGDGLLSGSG